MAKGKGAQTLAQWVTAVMAMKGLNDAMSVDDAVQMIHDTPQERRSKFAGQIWSNRKARSKGMKKRNSDADMYYVSSGYNYRKVKGKVAAIKVANQWAAMGKNVDVINVATNERVRHVTAKRKNPLGSKWTTVKARKLANGKIQLAIPQR